jgi:hypothetical protein
MTSASEPAHVLVAYLRVQGRTGRRPFGRKTHGHPDCGTNGPACVKAFEVSDTRPSSRSAR